MPTVLHFIKFCIIDLKLHTHTHIHIFTLHVQSYRGCVHRTVLVQRSCISCLSSSLKEKTRVYRRSCKKYSTKNCLVAFDTGMAARRIGDDVRGCNWRQGLTRRSSSARSAQGRRTAVGDEVRDSRGKAVAVGDELRDGRRKSAAVWDELRRRLGTSFGLLLRGFDLPVGEREDWRRLDTEEWGGGRGRRRGAAVGGG